MAWFQTWWTTLQLQLPLSTLKEYATWLSDRYQQAKQIQQSRQMERVLEPAIPFSYRTNSYHLSHSVYINISHLCTRQAWMNCKYLNTYLRFVETLFFFWKTPKETILKSQTSWQCPVGLDNFLYYFIFQNALILNVYPYMTASNNSYKISKEYQWCKIGWKIEWINLITTSMRSTT